MTPGIGAGVSVLFVFAGEALLKVGDLAAEACKVIESFVDARPVCLQVLGACFSDAIEILGALSFRSREPHLFKISERGVNHPGTRRIDAARVLLDRLD